MRRRFENLVSYERYKAPFSIFARYSLFENLVSYERYKAIFTSLVMTSGFENLVSYERYKAAPSISNSMLSFENQSIFGDLFRDGEFRTTGTDSDQILSSISHFGGGIEIWNKRYMQYIGGNIDGL